MRPTSSPSASSTVKAAALLMAVPALLLPMKVAAQQMAAANTPDFSTCDRLAVSTPAKAIQCRVDVLKAHGVAADARGVAADARGAAADARGAAADARGAAADVRMARAEDGVACAKFLISKKAEGVALDATRVNREKGCIYARELGMP